MSSFRESRSGTLGSLLDTIGILLTYTAAFFGFHNFVQLTSKLG